MLFLLWCIVMMLLLILLMLSKIEDHLKVISKNVKFFRDQQ